MCEHWFTTEDLREIDTLTVERYGMPSILLMEHAALALHDSAMELIARRALVGALILCGPGNNGGDGFALARLLANAGICTRILATRAPDALAGDARVNAHILIAMGLPIVLAHDAESATHERAALGTGPILIVDALLGTGLSTPATGLIADLIDWINQQCHDAILAVDVPSGFHADKGPILRPCVRADQTVTFVGYKIGFADPFANEFLGRVIVAEIGAPTALVRERAKPRPNIG